MLSLRLAGMIRIRKYFNQFWLSYVTLFTGLGASFYFYHVTIGQIHHRQESEFGHAVARFQDMLRLYFSCHCNILHSLAAFYSRPQLPDNQEFHKFIKVQDLPSMDANVGLLDMGYYARLNDSEREQLMDVLIKNDVPEQNRIWLENSTDSDWILVHWDNFKTNSLTAVASYTARDAVRLAAMNKAAESNDMACTEKMTILLGNAYRSNSFLFFLPVYRTSEIPSSPEERVKAVKGFAFASFAVSDYLKKIYDETGEPSIRFEVFDGQETLPEKLWFDSLALTNTAKIPAGYSPKCQYSEELEAAGRIWTFRYTALPQFDDTNEILIPHLILMGGAFVSFCFFVLINRQLRAYWQNLSLLQDINAANRAIAKEKTLLQVTLQSIGDAMFTLDAEGHVILMNPMSESLTGVSQQDASGRPIEAVAVLSTAELGDNFQYPLDFVRQSGKIWRSTSSLCLRQNERVSLPVALTVSPMRDETGVFIGFVLGLRDITERQKLIEQQIKSSKLESIGLLAGGIAHDFNNLLTAILGNISLARLELHNDGPSNAPLADAETACGHARELTQQLLTFAKGGAPARKTIQIKGILLDASRFAIQGSASRCNYDIPSDIWPVEADKTQMAQVIQNIVINAVEAMPQGGIIEIKVRNIDIPAQNPHSLKPGRYVKISIKDHGNGIPQDQLDKVFDPYYSTKKRGSGLGLTTAYSIVKRHEGFISVESAHGEGTQFDILLPVSEKAVQHKNMAPSSEPAAPGMRILVMDDDGAVLNAISKMLSRLGHEVVTAQNGESAIAIYKDFQTRNLKLDAVILDLTIAGGMGGLDTIRELLVIDPGVRAIVSSGYSNDPVMAQYREYGFKGIVPKPFTLATLSEALACSRQ